MFKNDFDIIYKGMNLAFHYAEVEFIKTEYYKTPFTDNVAYSTFSQ
jgi:hypothetical protein